MDNELKMIRKEAVVAEFRVLSCFMEELRETMKTRQDSQSLSPD
jgi:hypothetical protein